MTQPLRIGIAGLGTVGLATVDLLKRNATHIEKRVGRSLVVSEVTARDRNRERGIDTAGINWVEGAVELARSDNIDVFAELIGGTGVAKAAIEAALDAGKPVVTANKALLAEHGLALARRCEEVGVGLYFEAAVAGGVPIIKALRDSLAGNKVSRIYGIMNGTCNYILTKMESTGREFDDVLGEAQGLGYAEADPTFDIDGVDTAHKLAIVSSIAFGVPVDLKSIHIEGIRHVTAADIAYASKLGFRIKLLGLALQTPHGLEQRVHPCMIPASSTMAHVEGVRNALFVEGDFVGPLVFEGLGAGAGPTASAVVGDIVDSARGFNSPVFGLHTSQLVSESHASAQDRWGPCYIRCEVSDQPGVLADIAARLRDHSVSIESVLQRGRDPGERVSVILTTHDSGESNFSAALKEIGNLPTLADVPCMIRIENF